MKLKKQKIKLFLIGAIIASTNLYAASIDHIQNYTAEYNANMAQQAAVNPGTSPYFNPAGLMQLENGTYVTGGVQLAFGQEKMTYKTKHDGVEKNHKSDLLAPIPDLAIVTKDDNRAIFWTFGGIAGGGDLEYKKGVAGITVLEDVDLNLGKFGFGINAEDTGSWAVGENMYAQTTVGTAWNINEKLSVSVAGRLVYGWRNLDVKLKADMTFPALPIDQRQHLYADMESSRTAWGVGGQVGINYKPNDTWNFAARYDSKIRLTFEADAKSNNVTLDVGGKKLQTDLGVPLFFPQYADGAKHRRDLPAILALGATQQLTDNWKMFYGFNYYFNESAKIDKSVKIHNVVTDKYETGIDYDNGWEVSLGTEYKLNDKWSLLGGMNYAKTGAPKDSYCDVEFAIDSFLVGAGVRYKPDETTEWVVSTSHYFYEKSEGNFKEKYPGANAQSYDKNVSSIGVSYAKKF